jgi:FtsZ-interacting cell division protein YlmF
MTGVAYAIHGDLRRIANNTYVVTPDNVKVSDSEEAEAAIDTASTTEFSF